MKLKRHYTVDESVPVEEGQAAPMKLDFIEVQHTGFSPAQNFSTRMVAGGLGEGWLSIQDGKLILKAQPESLEYKILRVPGKYPSKTEKAGYEVINHYECVLNDKQHAAYCAKTEAERREAMYLLQGITPKKKSHLKEVARG